MSRITATYALPRRAKQRLDLCRRGGAGIRLVPRTLRHRFGYRGQLLLGDAEVPEPFEAAETGELLHAATRIVRAERFAEPAERVGRELFVEPQRGREHDRVHGS